MLKSRNGVVAHDSHLSFQLETPANASRASAFNFYDSEKGCKKVRIDHIPARLKSAEPKITFAWAPQLLRMRV